MGRRDYVSCFVNTKQVWFPSVSIIKIILQDKKKVSFHIQVTWCHPANTSQRSINRWNKYCCVVYQLAMQSQCQNTHSSACVCQYFTINVMRPNDLMEGSAKLSPPFHGAGVAKREERWGEELLARSGRGLFLWAPLQCSTCASAIPQRTTHLGRE